MTDPAAEAGGRADRARDPGIRGELLLSCHGVEVKRGARVVLDHIDLELRDGEVVAVLGPNGAGKSTLLDVLAGAIAPSAGAIERHARTAVALQSPDLTRGSVLANVTAALAWWGVPRVQRRERAQQALALLGAGHLAGRPAGELSGGERRRVHLARVFAVRPGVLMVDEPFAGLDGAARAALLEETGVALRSSARAALVVVHDRAEAWALADRLIVLIDGRIVASGTPRDLLAQPPSREVARFLGFDGELTQPGGRVLMTRPQHVVLDPDGDHRAEVTQLIPTEDGMRLALALEHGRVHCLAALPCSLRGERVRVRITGGVSFADEAPEATARPAVQPEPTVAPAAPQREIP